VSTGPLCVVALGGNALLPRGEKPEAATQALAARGAATALAAVPETTRLVVTHGNGPQVGLLALMNDAYVGVAPYPLDVLDAETEGQIGYMIELELDNAIDHQHTVAIITRVLVDAGDPAFLNPTKFIGPVYPEEEARALAARRGWAVKPDGDAWRRVVASPEPRKVVQLAAIRRLVESGFLVVCAGGGGIPVVKGRDGQWRGIEAVIDKDFASALLAASLGVPTFVVSTGVEKVAVRFRRPDQRFLDRMTLAEAREHLAAGEFPEGSMGPKVRAAIEFVERGGKEVVITSPAHLEEALAGETGTHVVAA
jgi:carbamate kinase